MLAEAELRQALSAGVALAFARGRRSPPAAPVEAAVGSHATAKRRREFASGRDCARRALAELGVEPRAIPVGPLREPVWPGGITGSITHCRSISAAAVCWRGSYPAIGIDAEVHRPLDPRACRLIASEEEYDGLPEGPEPVHWEAVLFSAKESIFKAWSPVRREWLGFGDTKVTIDARRRTFRGAISRDEAGLFATVDGVFVVHADLVLTAVVVPRPPRPDLRGELRKGTAVASAWRSPRRR